MVNTDRHITKVLEVQAQATTQGTDGLISCHVIQGSFLHNILHNLYVLTSVHVVSGNPSQLFYDVLQVMWISPRASGER